jgi:hypothetical protein
MITAAVHPAAKFHCFIDLFQAGFTTIMTTHRILTLDIAVDFTKNTPRKTGVWDQSSMTAATAAATSAAPGRGLVLARIGHVLPAAGLEVRLVPATALEAEPGRGNELPQLGLATFGTILQGRIAHFLHDFQLVVASLASIFIERHIATSITVSSRVNRRILT